MAVPRELEDFCSREYDRLVGAVWLYCGDRELAVELAQEALLRVCRDWERVRSMASPGGWAHRVAINLATSQFRRRAVARRARHRVVGHHEVAWRDPDGADVQAVRAALSELTDKQRAAIVLRYYGDLPYAEIAQALRTTESSVKALLHRASARLRALLGDNEPEVLRVG